MSLFMMEVKLVTNILLCGDGIAGQARNDGQGLAMTMIFFAKTKAKSQQIIVNAPNP